MLEQPTRTWWPSTFPSGGRPRSVKCAYTSVSRDIVKDLLRSDCCWKSRRVDNYAGKTVFRKRALLRAMYSVGAARHIGHFRENYGPSLQQSGSSGADVAYWEISKRTTE